MDVDRLRYPLLVARTRNTGAGTLVQSVPEVEGNSHDMGSGGKGVEVKTDKAAGPFKKQKRLRVRRKEDEGEAEQYCNQRSPGQWALHGSRLGILKKHPYRTRNMHKPYAGDM